MLKTMSVADLLSLPFLKQDGKAAVSERHSLLFVLELMAVDNVKQVALLNEDRRVTGIITCRCERAHTRKCTRTHPHAYTPHTQHGYRLDEIQLSQPRRSPKRCGWRRAVGSAFRPRGLSHH